jgi:hypothetical protein
MTEQEMREQKIRLRLELEDAETQLAHLREEAYQQAESLGEFSHLLSTEPHARIYRDGDNYGQNVIGLSEANVKAMDLERALNTANQIRKTMQKVRQLTDRLSALP